MEAIERIWLSVQPQSPKRTTVGWLARGGRAVEKMPHLLSAEPSHHADSAPAEEPTWGGPRGAWPDRRSTCSL